MNIKDLLMNVGSWFWDFKQLLPIGFSIIVLIIDAVKDILVCMSINDFSCSMKIVMIRTFGIDYRIWELVNIFKLTPELFGWKTFWLLIMNAYALFLFIKLIVWCFRKTISEDASAFMFYVWSMGILALLELGTVGIFLKTWFVPLSGFLQFIYYFPRMFAYLWETRGFDVIWNKFVDKTVDTQLKNQVMLNKSVIVPKINTITNITNASNITGVV